MQHRCVKGSRQAGSASAAGMWCRQAGRGRLFRHHATPSPRALCGHGGMLSAAWRQTRADHAAMTQHICRKPDEVTHRCRRPMVLLPKVHPPAHATAIPRHSLPPPRTPRLMLSAPMPVQTFHMSCNNGHPFQPVLPKMSKSAASEHTYRNEENMPAFTPPNNKHIRVCRRYVICYTYTWRGVYA